MLAVFLAAGPRGRRGGRLPPTRSLLRACFAPVYRGGGGGVYLVRNTGSSVEKLESARCFKTKRDGAVSYACRLENSSYKG